ncbi:MAG: ferritin-like domain-containing protein [Polyangiaceae bacterium]
MRGKPQRLPQPATASHRIARHLGVGLVALLSLGPACKPKRPASSTGAATPIPAQGGWRHGPLYCLHLAESAPDGDRCGDEPAALFNLPDQPPGVHGFALDEEGTAAQREQTADACCYRAYAPMKGRPLRDEAGAARVAPLARMASGGHPEGDAWAEDGALEHAAVAELHRVALALLALGAPPHLVADCLAAAREEVGHASLAFDTARALGVHRRPAGLDLHTVVPATSRRALVADSLADGCIGECLGAAELFLAAALTPDPLLRARLARMGREEQRHAELAYAIVAWSLASASTEERPELLALVADQATSVDHALVEARGTALAAAATTRAGRLDATSRRQATRDALALAVRPALHALLVPYSTGPYSAGPYSAAPYSAAPYSAAPYSAASAGTSTASSASSRAAQA